MLRTIASTLCLLALSCSSMPEALSVALAPRAGPCEPAAAIRTIDARDGCPPTILGGTLDENGTLDAQVQMVGVPSVAELLGELVERVLCEAQASSSGLRPLPAAGDEIVLVVEDLVVVDDGHGLQFRARVGFAGTAPAAWLRRRELLFHAHVPFLRQENWARAFEAGLDQWVDSLRESWSPETRGRSLLDVRVRR